MQNYLLSNFKGMEKLHVTIWNQVIPNYIVKWLGTEGLKWDFLGLNPDSLIAVYEQDA